jgi:hypothetical protein
MQLSRISAGLGMVMLLANVALAQKVTTDDSTSADFSQYKTFMWIKEPRWRGTSSKPLSGNPEKNAQHLNEAIRKMFRNFPPTGGKHGE